MHKPRGEIVTGRSEYDKSRVCESIEGTGRAATLAQAEAAYEKLFAIIGAALQKGDAVSISGFGGFKVVNRKARKGRNPRTGKEIQIPASKAVKFTAGKALKDGL